MKALVSKWTNWTESAAGRWLEDIGLLILRLSIGLSMMLAHGLGKLMSYSEQASKWADPIGVGPEMSMALAIFAEFFCSIGIVTGFLTRLAAIPLIVTMLVAALLVHGADPFSVKELAVMYLTGNVVLLLTGPGRISIDGLIGSRFSDRSTVADQQ